MRTFSSRTYRPERPLVRTSHFEIGEFHANPLESDFERLASPFNRPHFVFPSSPVVIETDTGHHFVADRGRALAYPANLSYRRFALTGRGDHCMWVAPLRSVFAMDTPFGEFCRMLARRELEPQCVQFPDGLFLEQRTILYALTNGRIVLDLDKRMLHVCSSLAVTPAGSRDHPLAVRVDETLAERYQEKVTLTRIAQKLGVSSEHISRVYRKAFETSIHRRIIQLRTRDAFERILDGEKNLTVMALDLGFSSHSHLTATMRTTFGKAPTQIRTMIARRSALLRREENRSGKTGGKRNVRAKTHRAG